MGVGVFLESLVVVVLLLGGAWINRTTDFSSPNTKSQWHTSDPFEEVNAALQSYQNNGELVSNKTRSLSPSLLPSQESCWRERDISILGLTRRVTSPNTAVFRNRLLSRLLRKFPFLVECWYWALIYWVSRNRSVYSRLTR